jgi:hypothetical protein
MSGWGPRVSICSSSSGGQTPNLNDLLLLANNMGFLTGETYDKIESSYDLDENLILKYTLGGFNQFQLTFELNNDGTFTVSKSGIPVLLTESGDILTTESGDYLVL